jgi:hypothetical protein
MFMRVNSRWPTTQTAWATDAIPLSEFDRDGRSAVQQRRRCDLRGPTPIPRSGSVPKPGNSDSYPNRWCRRGASRGLCPLDDGSAIVPPKSRTRGEWRDRHTIGVAPTKTIPGDW